MLTVGDNIYKNGIEYPGDFSYADKIMSNFQKPNLKNIPMYVAAGNHDCYSDLNNEIEYSNHNKQWRFE